jgi:hypothetical protein
MSYSYYLSLSVDLQRPNLCVEVNQQQHATSFQEAETSTRRKATFQITPSTDLMHKLASALNGMMIPFRVVIMIFD